MNFAGYCFDCYKYLVVLDDVVHKHLVVDMRRLGARPGAPVVSLYRPLLPDVLRAPRRVHHKRNALTGACGVLACGTILGLQLRRRSEIRLDNDL